MGLAQLSSTHAKSVTLCCSTSGRAHSLTLSDLLYSREQAAVKTLRKCSVTTAAVSTLGADEGQSPPHHYADWS